MEPYYQHAGVTLWQGDCRAVLATLPDQSVQTCVSSPPYFGLRSYGTEPQTWGGSADCEHEWVSTAYYREGGGSGSSAQAFSEAGPDNAARLKETRWRDNTRCQKCGAWTGELGGEPSPDVFVQNLASVFREVRRCLRDDGTVWLNLGDSYNGSMKGANGDGTWQDRSGTKQGTNKGALNIPPTKIDGLKPKDLIGIPWRVAFALQADGWYLRSDIVWAKPNPMPESVTDRPTRSHEYIFLLSKSARYYYDQMAIADVAIYAEQHANKTTSWGTNRKHPNKANVADYMYKGDNHTTLAGGMRNKRDVWTIATAPYPEAHFATFPPKLIEPCILAGAPAGGVVLDPFAGAGTTLMVAKHLNRQAVGIELNGDYCQLIVSRLAQDVLPLEGIA